MDAKTLIDYTASLDCIHCGLCLTSCPTYRLTGVESSSPRGRIHLMRSVAEGELDPDRHFAEEMEFCLLCRNCESVCPSGVRFGHMMEHTRAELGRSVPRSAGSRAFRWLFLRVLLPHRIALRMFSAFGRLAQQTGLLRLAARFSVRAKAIAHAPEIPKRAERRPLDAFAPAIGARVGEVAVLEGCVMPELYGRVNRATASFLRDTGWDVHSPRGHVCCGSLHAHNGDRDEARRLAKLTIAAFDSVQGVGADRTAPPTVVVNSAGCSAHMKELALLFDDDPEWRARAERFAARVRDFSEFVASEQCGARVESLLRRARADASWGRVTYDDPCHLCHGQQIREPPRRLLDLVPGLQRVNLRDSELCCGSAGIYSILRPQDSAAVFAEKLAALRESGADTLVTANPGCQLQWETGLRKAGEKVRVLHLAEVLAEASRRATAP